MTGDSRRELRVIRARSEREAAWLAGEFARSATIDREAVLASLEFERWLIEACQDAE